MPAVGYSFRAKTETSVWAQKTRLLRKARMTQTRFWRTARTTTCSRRTASVHRNSASHNPVKRAPRLHINVGGRHFEVARALLALHPTTRLGRLALLIDGEHAPHAEELLELCDDFSSPAPAATSTASANVTSNQSPQSELREGPTVYFERESTALPMLLNYYRTGRLHISEDMCTINFAEELEYWSIDQVCAVQHWVCIQLDPFPQQ